MSDDQEPSLELRAELDDIERTALRNESISMAERSRGRPLTEEELAEGDGLLDRMLDKRRNRPADPPDGR